MFSVHYPFLSFSRERKARYQYTTSYDEVRSIDESEGRHLARRLAKEDIFVGVSSGMNVAGALQLAQVPGPGHTAVTEAVDTE